MAESTLLSTVLVEDTWWDLKDVHFVSEGEADTSLLALTPTTTVIPEDN